jgi:hypothetical protein
MEEEYLLWRARGELDDPGGKGVVQGGSESDQERPRSDGNERSIETDAQSQEIGPGGWMPKHQ